MNGLFRPSIWRSQDSVFVSVVALVILSAAKNPRIGLCVFSPSF